MAKHSGVLRAIRKRLSDLENRLKSLEQRFLSNTDESVKEEFQALLKEYHDTADSEIKHLGKYSTARNYGEGERPGSVLASLLKKCREQMGVVEINVEEGEALVDSTAIAGRFEQY